MSHEDTEMAPVDDHPLYSYPPPAPPSVPPMRTQRLDFFKRRQPGSSASTRDGYRSACPDGWPQDPHPAAASSSNRATRTDTAFPTHTGIAVLLAQLLSAGRSPRQQQEGRSSRPGGRSWGQQQEGRSFRPDADPSGNFYQDAGQSGSKRQGVPAPDREVHEKELEIMSSKVISEKEKTRMLEQHLLHVELQLHKSQSNEHELLDKIAAQPQSAVQDDNLDELTQMEAELQDVQQQRADDKTAQAKQMTEKANEISGLLARLHPRSGPLVNLQGPFPSHPPRMIPQCISGRTHEKRRFEVVEALWYTLAPRTKPQCDANGRFSIPYKNLSRNAIDLNTVRTPANSTPADTPPSTPSSLTPSPPSSDDQLPTFEEPLANSILHAPSVTTTTFHTTTPDYDSDEMPMDAWDGDTDKLSAQDFLRGFHRNVKVSTSSTDKAKAFKNYLVANSDADDWYKTLPAATKADMDLIDIVIEVQYPAEATVQQSLAEYATDLLRLKLTMEELGTKVIVADREVWAHHAWCAKMMRLALKANVSTTTTYIEQVCVELPGPLRKKIGKMYANWAAFIKAIRNVDTAELMLDMKEWREEKAQRDAVTKMLTRVPSVQASPTAGIRAQLTNARLGPTVQQPARWTALVARGNEFQTTGGGQGNLFAAPCAQQQPQALRIPYQAQARAPPAIQPPLEGDQRHILVEAMARIIHHPDTDAGRLAHADQQQEWWSMHRNVEMSVNTPYPLRPGHAPANSGECFRCGLMGHTNYMHGGDASQDQCVSAREQKWRRIAAQALKEAPVGVRVVGFGSRDVDGFGWPFGGDEDRFQEGVGEENRDVTDEITLTAREEEDNTKMEGMAAGGVTHTEDAEDISENMRGRIIANPDLPISKRTHDGNVTSAADGRLDGDLGHARAFGAVRGRKKQNEHMRDT
ncbi:hypothetical protein B0H17DRAFT_1123973 [Mycena rosella]|uniref:Uncharacterized protein n=1 Tax=Mycena rosella TaxID=1033263 RepID=A0AAD7H2Y3_MYCRO|nr:hypothetical protein B0H17DRAFT_1123973 [Mycena rosella]